MLWNRRCLKHYYREVKNSGRLEDKDFCAVALLCSGFFGRHDIGKFGAGCTTAFSIDRRNRRHENRT
jgi:hypothetical protein